MKKEASSLQSCEASWSSAVVTGGSVLSRVTGWRYPLDPISARGFDERVGCRLAPRRSVLSPGEIQCFTTGAAEMLTCPGPVAQVTYAH